MTFRIKGRSIMRIPLDTQERIRTQYKRVKRKGYNFFLNLKVNTNTMGFNIHAT